jgi:2,4-dienoyl-CoA reductase (NADPH2)
MVNGVEYLKVDDAGLHVRVHGEPQLLEVDTVIVCAGQLPLRDLYDELVAAGVKATLVGGAFEASELDAKRAIDQASRLAAGGVKRANPEIFQAFLALSQRGMVIVCY